MGAFYFYEAASRSSPEIKIQALHEPSPQMGTLDDFDQLFMKQVETRYIASLHVARN